MKPGAKWLLPVKRLDERYTVAENVAWLDNPKNWKPCNRPLTPAEKMYAWRARQSEMEDER